MSEITLRDLRLMATTTPQLIMLGLLDVGNSYAKFVDLIEQALDWIAQELARNPELRQDKSEDQITAEVITALKAMGFGASHETKVGGHCDITVEGRQELLWLGEAKIHRSTYAYLYKGFEQLNTRYSTGGPNQDAGGMLIYCFKPRVDSIMSSWARYLAGKIGGLSTEQCTKNPLAFRSRHTHERTGRAFQVRHVPISLHFAPRDRAL